MLKGLKIQEQNNTRQDLKLLVVYQQSEERQSGYPSSQKEKW